MKSMNANVGIADRGIASAEITVARAAAQEAPDDDDREQRALDERIDRRMIGPLRMRFGREYRRQAADAGILGHDLLELLVDRLRNGDVGCADRFRDAEGRRRAPVETRERAHLLDAVVHIGDLPQAH